MTPQHDRVKMIQMAQRKKQQQMFHDNDLFSKHLKISLIFQLLLRNYSPIHASRSFFSRRGRVLCRRQRAVVAVCGGAGGAQRPMTDFYGFERCWCIFIFKMCHGLCDYNSECRQQADMLILQSGTLKLARHFRYNVAAQRLDRPVHEIRR